MNRPRRDLHGTTVAPAAVACQGGQHEQGNAVGHGVTRTHDSNQRTPPRSSRWMTQMEKSVGPSS